MRREDTRTSHDRAHTLLLHSSVSSNFSVHGGVHGGHRWDFILEKKNVFVAHTEAAVEGRLTGVGAPGPM